MSFEKPISLGEYRLNFEIDCSNKLLYYLGRDVNNNVKRFEILGFSSDDVPHTGYIPTYSYYCSNHLNSGYYCLPYSLDKVLALRIVDYDDTDMITLLLDGSQDEDYLFLSRSSSYSEDCPFSYQYYMYYRGTLPRYNLRIYKGSAIVYDEFCGISMYQHESETYAMSIMQPLIDKCIEDNKTPTTCCLLVCCEPSKYRLVEV